MKANFSIKRSNTILSSVLRLSLMFYIIAVLSGINIPLISGKKANFIGLIIIGVAISMASNWRFIIGLRLTDPINIIGSLLGAIATLVIIFTLKDISIPFISGYSTEFQVLAVLLIIKVGLKVLQDRKEKIPSTEN